MRDELGNNILCAQSRGSKGGYLFILRFYEYIAQFILVVKIIFER